MHYSPNKSSSPPQLSRRLLLCALSAWGLDTTAATASPAPSLSRPYLLAILPPALRIEPSRPAVTLPPVEPVVVGPPHPAGLVEEIASANHQSAVPVPAGAATSAAHPPAPVQPPEPATARVEMPPALPPPPEPSPDSIIPDDTPRQIRPQDVLMYFRFPQGQPPPSSATYRQQ